MARVVKTYDERHREILDAAQTLFYTKGYEQTSIKDIIAAVGIAKGTFYHYFDSKSDLLDTLIRRMLEESLQLVEPLVANEEMTALEKLRCFFAVIGTWKTERKSFLLDILRSYFDDDNMILRQRMKIETIRMMDPVLSEIIRQGAADGSFATEYAGEMAAIVITLAQALSENLAALLLCPSGKEDPLLTAERSAAVHQYAIEKILGADEGSLPFIEMDNLRQWFAVSETADLVVAQIPTIRSELDDQIY